MRDFEKMRAELQLELAAVALQAERDAEDVRNKQDSFGALTDEIAACSEELQRLESAREDLRMLQRASKLKGLSPEDRLREAIEILRSHGRQTADLQRALEG